jgi:deazaflavin-dependent oxidoreductase (nitroreductase family)
MRRASLLIALPAVLLAFLLLLRVRPRSVARFNRVVTNPIARQFAGRAPGFGIVFHRGRRSGRLYRTPVNVFAIPEGFSIALTYGRDSEWVKNVLAEGSCTLETRGRRYHLSGPGVVHDPRHRLFPLPLRVILAIGGVSDFLRLAASTAPPLAVPAGEDGR